MHISLTGLEIASGSVWGSITDVALPPVSNVASPLVALERALLEPLTRAPCLLSFSGGKDSSLLLALAARVARREGLPMPVPVTWRFPHAPRADESQWQDSIIRALSITDWQIFIATDELDILGPVAQQLLRSYGVRYPANLQLHQPIIQAAAGGSVVTGLGGDQVLSSWFQPSPGRLARSRRLVPAALRAAARPRQAVAERPWLRPEVARLVHRLERRDSMGQPADPPARLAWRARRRDLMLTRASAADLARGYDVQLHHPLLDPAFHAALRATIPPNVSVTRSQLIAEIADATVPHLAYARTSKAWFGEVFRGEPSKRFVADWDGAGVDETLVNADDLRALWANGLVRAGTELLAQHLWLQQDEARRAVSASTTSLA